MKLERRSLRIAAGLAAVSAAALTLVLAVAIMLPRAAAAHGGMGGPGGAGDGTYLAEALGITTAELQTAQEKARDAAIDQAVTKGLLTAEQAAALKARAGLGLRGFGHRGMGRGLGGEIDQEALLADALGISVDQLRTARDTAFEAGLKAALDADRITETQAEAMRAHNALKAYMEKQGVDAKMRAVHEEAIKSAVAAGVITQAQADALKNGQGFGGRGGFGGPGAFGGRGGRGGHGGHGGFGGRGGFGGGSGDTTPAPGTNGTSGPAFAFPGSDL